MTDVLKSLLYYLMMLSAFALMIFTIGCNTENPLCSQNYCVSGEVFLRSQLLEGEEFSEVNVAESSLIAAFANTTPQTPVETTPVPVETTDVSLADVLADAAADNTTYLNQTVTITGYVVWKSDQRDTIAIYKNANVLAAINEPVFFIASLENTARLDKYVVGKSYTFTVTISKYAEPEEAGKFPTIVSVFPE